MLWQQHLCALAILAAALCYGEVPERDAKGRGNALQICVVADNDGDLTSQLPCHTTSIDLNPSSCANDPCSNSTGDPALHPENMDMYLLSQGS